jgi:hypothetical protein
MRTITNQSIIIWKLKTKSLLPPFTKGRNSPLWYPFPALGQAKRGKGRFSGEYV